MNYNYWINNIYYKNDININKTIFQKCSEKNIDLPCFCYHENLSIAGNCRMCLVEINTSLKLVVSCAMPLQNNIKIFTDNIRVKKARESVLEFLLVNHPLDCPICDQGGECDLQDITLIFGSDKSRFYEYFKRSVYDKECGPFIKMIMTRCIHCTRCIRFLSEISDNYEFGMVNRGNNSEITTFIEKSLIDELSGNIIDLCPVGALTSKPFAFTARSWELNSLETIDILDSMASSIRVDYLNNNIYRILPIYDKYINEDWITNKIRFCYDCQKIQRLFFPLLKFKLTNLNFNLNWIDSFYIYYFWLKIFFLSKDYYTNIIFFFGNYNDINTIYNIKSFLDVLGLDIYFIEHFLLNYDFRYNYLIDINNLDSLLIIIGINLRVELPILYSKLKRKKIKIYNYLINNFLGIFVDNKLISLKNLLLFKMNNLNLLKNKFFNVSILNLNKQFKNVVFFFGIKFLCQNKINLEKLILFYFNKFFNYIKINNIISNISNLNLFEIGLNFKILKTFLLKNNFLFLNNIDNDIYYNLVKNVYYNTNYIVYNGSFYDKGSKLADLLFPINIFFEYSGIFINIEGKIRKMNKIINFNKIIYTSSNLFKILYLYLNKNIKFMFFIFIYLKILNLIKFFSFIKFNWNIDYNYYILKFDYYLLKQNDFLNNCLFNNNIIINYIYNYYKYDIISKFSKNLHLAALDYSKKILILN